MKRPPVRRYLLAHLGVGLGVLLAVAATNFVVDPLEVYRAQWYRPTYLGKVPQYLNPGLARHHRYDAVIVGTSHTGNIVPSELRAAWGWDAIKFTIPGGNLQEQSETLKLALATGQVRHVLWCLDKQSFEGPQDPRSLAGTRLPEHLYRPTWQTHPRYLASLDTLACSWRVGRGRGARSLDELYVWHHRAKYREALVWESLAHELRTRAPVDRQRHARGEFAPAVLRANAQAFVFDVIAAHPDVEFVFYWPPYPIVHYLYDAAVAPDQFATRQAFKVELNERLLALPHCRVYDFQTLTRVTHNLDLYWDMGHFHKDVSDETLAMMRHDEERVTHENNAARVAELTRQVDAFRADMPARVAAHPELTGLWPPPR